jgi:hypothetical protein
MLEIAESNSETSNNNIRLVVITLIISVAKLVVTTLIIPVIATLLKLAIITPLKRSAYKVAGGYIASSAS